MVAGVVIILVMPAERKYRPRQTPVVHPVGTSRNRGCVDLYQSIRNFKTGINGPGNSTEGAIASFSSIRQMSSTAADSGARASCGSAIAATRHTEGCAAVRPKSALG